ncbi:DUF485 domain-containing protein [Streptomyces sp. P1-3]|uniref:DUF485 domain-containing protein n=1 Tax=Streptomyces sp. P1-3 TaxID=3421658 RepID=UPI003D35FABD
MDNHDGQDELQAGTVRLGDPWYDTLASGRGEPDEPPAAGTDVYQQVHAGADFQEVRRRYRRFALPAAVAFLVWYLGYVIAATGAPDLMARPVTGPFNVGMLAGVAQFATTFLLTWAYARHARLRRDRLALELRWVTQEMAARERRR